jgi:ACT domain-containing protein
VEEFEKENELLRKIAVLEHNVVELKQQRDDAVGLACNTELFLEQEKKEKEEEIKNAKKSGVRSRERETKYEESRRESEKRARR